MPCDNGGGSAGRNRRPIPRRQLLDLALLLMGCATSDKVFYLSEPSPPSSAKWRAGSKVSVVPLSGIGGPCWFPSCQRFVEALGRLCCAAFHMSRFVGCPWPLVSRGCHSPRPADASVGELRAEAQGASVTCQEQRGGLDPACPPDACSQWAVCILSRPQEAIGFVEESPQAMGGVVVLCVFLGHTYASLLSSPLPQWQLSPWQPGLCP